MKATRLQALRDMQERGTIRRGHVIEMLAAIDDLRERINTLGEFADVCVRSDLGGDICSGCRCGKSDKSNAVVNGG